MKRKYVVLCLVGASIIAVILALPLSRSSQLKTRSISSVAEVIPYFDLSRKSATLEKVKEEFSVRCDQQENLMMPVSATSQVVRIKFTDCDQLIKKAPLYSIKNLTNGYDGQVFKSSETPSVQRGPASARPSRSSVQLSTDYIQLQSGENVIELQISLNDGQKINKKITITRQ